MKLSVSSTAERVIGRRTAAHLLRRTGFGATAGEIDALAGLGYRDAVEQIISDLATPDPAADAISPPGFRSRDLLTSARGADQEARRAAARAMRAEGRATVGWWLRRMAAAQRPVREKLAMLWHDHFATSIRKVRLAELIYRHQRTIAANAAGRFDVLLGAIARDPAMLVWLDGRDNRAGAPNENFAREFFELFTLGHGHHGSQPYTEADVTDAARALTGWRIDPNGEASFERRRFDRGTKHILGHSGPFGLDDVVRIATNHPDCAPHVVARLWSRIGRRAAVDDPVVVELAADFGRDLDVAALLRRILLHPAFVADDTHGALVKTPVEWLIGASRALGAPPAGWWGTALAGLGQVPLAPSDVAGWPANEGWLSTASAHVRLDSATSLVDDATVGAVATPEDAAHVLGVERWSPPTLRALSAAEQDRDGRGLLVLALVSPDYLLN